MLASAERRSHHRGSPFFGTALLARCARKFWGGENRVGSSKSLEKSPVWPRATLLRPFFRAGAVRYNLCHAKFEVNPSTWAASRTVDVSRFRVGRRAATAGGGRAVAVRPPPLGGGGRLGLRRRPPPAGGGGRAAAVRPPPAAAARRPTLKRDTSTVLDGDHVHEFASKLVCTQVLTYGTGPAQKKGVPQRSMGSQPQFCPTLVPSLPTRTQSASGNWDYTEHHTCTCYPSFRERGGTILNKDKAQTRVASRRAS